jgi:tol-pal system protein YbgF
MNAPKLNWARPRRVLAAAIGAAVLGIAVAASAQTIISAPTADPLVEGLRDRANALETQVRNLIGDNERLQFQLRQAKEDNARLERALQDMQQQQAAPAQASAVAPATGGMLGTLPQGDVAGGVTLPAGGDPAAAYTQAYALVANGKYADAQTAFSGFLSAYPKDTRAPSARYWLGQSLLQQGANSDAASQFLTIVKQSPKAEMAPDALVRLGVALNRMGQKAEACATLASLNATYPKATPATKASGAANAKAIGC